MTEEFYSVSELARKVGALEVQMSSISTTQTLNHNQNRSDIHELRGLMQVIVDKIHGLELKNAKWSLAAGVATAVLLKVLDHVVK